MSDGRIGAAQYTIYGELEDYATAGGSALSRNWPSMGICLIETCQTLTEGKCVMPKRWFAREERIR